MQTEIIKHKKFAVLLILGVLSIASLFTSCKKDDENNNVELFSYGPVPIARGAEMRFIGANLQQVTSIVLPTNIEILAADFGSQTSDLITITVPQNAVEGFVVLKHANGEITTKTPIGFSEPITLDAFSPSTIKPGSELTITGDYLYLIGEVIFSKNAIIDSSDFISQSRHEIKLIVPNEAQTGKIAISNGAADPIIIYSSDILTLPTPTITEIGPLTIKAGTILTIKGTDLDMVKSVKFAGNKVSTDITNATDTQFDVIVPVDAQDGTISAILGSNIEIESADALVLVVPTISNIAPTSVLNGDNIVVTGLDLDLVTTVTFNGGAIGTIAGGRTATSITITVPDAALTGDITFTAASTKTVLSPVTIIPPAITSFTPASGKEGDEIVITGTNFDLVTKVIFTGNIEGVITSKTNTVIKVNIPRGAKTGPITIVAVNGVNINSASDLTTADLPDFTSYTEEHAKPGNILTINGSKLSLIKYLIFPGNIKATVFGVKTDTKIEVFVPDNVTLGFGQINIETFVGAIGVFPSINFANTDLILATTKMVNDYETHGAHDGSWDASWNTSLGVITTENGNTFLKSTGSINGWFINCNHQANGALGPIINNIENYALKLDVRIDAGVTGAENAEMQYVGAGWHWFGAGFFPASTTANDWITISIPVSSLGLTGTLDLSTGDNGIYGGPIPAGISVDNLRFDLK